MSHVVMQAAEFPSVDLAKRCETELRALIDAQIRFEAADPDPWGGKSVPAHLTAFGERHGVAWPSDEHSRFLAKGLFEDEAQLLQVDRMVFFWIPGFDLGGDTLRAILRKLGAVAAVGEGQCHLAIACDDPDARVQELTSFLVDEDFEDQFTVLDGKHTTHDYFSVTLEGSKHTKRIVFDDSGVQDWAFTALLPQLAGEDPKLV
ncbi:MAG TPA: hypothetical protein VGH87_18605 [Polyangiaceae bacterium]